MKISKNGIELIKRFEGCSLKSYKCPSGVWTIGFGHTHQVYEGMNITQGKADELLKQDLASFENTVNKFVTVPLSQNQFDALTSLTFNIGGGNFKNSTLLKKLNLKDYTGASQEFLRWDYANGKKLAGLTKRRQEEKKLFDTL